MNFRKCMRGYKNRMPVAFIAALVLLASGLLWHPDFADASRDERTISFYEIHTGRRITVTFKRDGRFIPEAMKKINWFMRDWRRNVPTKMDPHLIDLVWQLHEESGSKKPVHVVSGYRSPKTNAALRRAGGGQAKRSQHMRGKAMDIHFPDVPMSEVRKLAFKLEVGGVGYYPTSAIPFVHVDTARVRAWPRMSRTQLAMLFPYGRTKHRPARGGPLTLRDQKRARIRLAALARKKRLHSKVLLANASIPAARLSGNGTAYNGKPSDLATKAMRRTVLASLERAVSNKLEVPGLSPHAAHLWVNSTGRKFSPDLLFDSDSADNRPATLPSRANGSSHAKSPVTRPAAQKARIQLASLAPQERAFARPAPRSRLWVNGSERRARWLTETEIEPAMPRHETKVPASSQPRKTDEATARPAHAHQLASFRPLEKVKPPADEQRHFTAERVAYAPSYDAEHPEELAYRPFKILPLMTTKPVALNKALVAMREPRYDRVYEVIASSENLSMQFRPSAREAEALWNNQFKGKAIINIRKHARYLLPESRPTRIASR